MSRRSKRPRFLGSSACLRGGWSVRICSKSCSRASSLELPPALGARLALNFAFRSTVAARSEPACPQPQDRFVFRSLYLSRFQSDLDFGKFQRLARSVALQNTLHHSRPTPSQPNSNTNENPQSILKDAGARGGFGDSEASVEDVHERGAVEDHRVHEADRVADQGLLHLTVQRVLSRHGRRRVDLRPVRFRYVSSLRFRNGVLWRAAKHARLRSSSLDRPKARHQSTTVNIRRRSVRSDGRWTLSVDLEEPRSQLLVDDDVVAEQLERVALVRDVVLDADLRGSRVISLSLSLSLSLFDQITRVSNATPEIV